MCCLSEALLSMTRRHEGWHKALPDGRARAYWDRRQWSIGFGTLAAYEGETITRAEGLARLAVELAEAATAFERLFPGVAMAEARRDALINMLFNLGAGGLMTFRNMVRAIRAADWKRAAAEALDSQWAGQVGRRAEELATILRYGVYQSEAENRLHYGAEHGSAERD